MINMKLAVILDAILNLSIFALRKQSRPVVGKLSPTIAFNVFDCQILPILEYGSDIWYTGDDVNDLEKIHLKFIKSTLGVRKQTPTPAIYGDTGRFPLIIRQHIKVVKYWCRILKLSQSHPVRNAYNMLLELDAIGFTNWCSPIRSVNKSMLSFKESIVRIFTQRWRKDIESSSKLRTYALVKKYFRVEPYILHILKGEPPHNSNGEISNELTRSNIERGRFNNPITPKNQ